MDYLHSLDPPIIHCDLRSPNVLLMSLDYKEEIVAKIADFGLAQFSVGRHLINSSLNPKWSAPETLNARDLSPQSDVYSFGSILFELLTGNIPYEHNLDPRWKYFQNISEDVIKGIKPSYSIKEMEKIFERPIPQEVIEILEICWNHNPWDRPSFSLIIPSLASLIDMQHLSPKKEYVVNLSNFEEVNEDRIQKYVNIGKGIYTCDIEGWEGLFVIKEIEKEIKNMDPEYEHFKILQHPNLVKVCGYSQTPSQLLIITEYCNGGSLMNNLRTKKRSGNYFKEEELLFFIKEILKGLDFLHQNKYCHRDLKVFFKKK